MATSHRSLLPISARLLPGTRFFVVCVLAIGCAACSQAPPATDAPAEAPPTPVATSGPPAQAPAPPPEAGSVGTRTGTASFIASRLNGRKTASGEVYDGTRLVAAHPSYPMGTRLRVTNQENGRTVEVTVVDRSASGTKRPIVDLSRAAAEQLGFVERGTVTVTTEVIGRQTP